LKNRINTSLKKTTFNSKMLETSYSTQRDVLPHTLCSSPDLFAKPDMKPEAPIFEKPQKHDSFASIGHEEKKSNFKIYIPSPKYDGVTKAITKGKGFRPHICAQPQMYPSRFFSMNECSYKVQEEKSDFSTDNSPNFEKEGGNEVVPERKVTIWTDSNPFRLFDLKKTTELNWMTFLLKIATENNYLKTSGRPSLAENSQKPSMEEETKIVSGSKYIGTITPLERAQKIKLYIEKKKKRKWKAVKYTIRKHLAEKRVRFQGRFVKTTKPFSNLNDKPKGH